MKKILILLICVLIAVMLIGCNNDSTDSSQISDTDTHKNERMIVSYNTNCDDMVPQSKVPYGSTVFLPNNIKKEGYRLDGWYLNGEKWLNESSVTENMTLEAKWIPVEYKITYHRGEGTVHTYTIEDEIELPCAYDINGVFVGWSTDINGTSPFTAIKKGTTGNLELYAVKRYFHFDFTEKEDGTYEITGHDKINGETIERLVIPSEYNGKKVTSIGEKAFYYMSGVEAVEIPSSIIKVGAQSFSRSSVNKVIFSEGTQEIGKHAFNSSSVMYVHLPDSLLKLDEYAFCNCRKLIEINIPKNLIDLGYSSFTGCRELAIDLVIPEGVSTIWDETFMLCPKIKSVKLHKDITYIGDQAFQGCSSIKEIEIFSGSIGRYAFYYCTSLEKLVIHNDVKNIMSSAFEVNSLKYIMIYQGVDTIAYDAFHGVVCPIYTDATEKPKGWAIDVELNHQAEA